MKTRPRILIFTGDGKGKTTAALGMALRTAGHGWPALVVQFIKNNSTTGELLAAKAVPGLDIRQTGLGFVRPGDVGRLNGHRQAAQSGLCLAEEALASGRYRLIVLDEVCVAVAKGLIEEAQVLRFLEKAGPECVVVMTGRDATPGLVERADTVTDMRCVKHGFAAGIPAQQGVEH